MIYLAVVFLFCCPSSSDGYPTKCLANSFFDPVKQKYISCSECNKKNQAICFDCCLLPKQDSEDFYVQEPKTTEAIPSIKYEKEKGNRHVVGVFFHIFIIAMVACTLSVIVCVGFKVAKERQTNQCNEMNSRHSHNHDAAVIQEVLSIPQQGSMNNPTKSFSAVNHLPESISRQSGVRPML